MKTGSKITGNPNLIFYRHAEVDPNTGQPSSQSFCPMPKDNCCLSLDAGNKTSAQNAYNLFIANGYRADSTWAISLQEFNNERIDVWDDSQHNNSAHSVADYSIFNKSQQKSISRRLKDKAIGRGRQYP